MSIERVGLSRSRRGSLFVEAAISLPLFILAVVSLILVIRLLGCAEHVMREYTEQAGKIATEAYAVERLTEMAGVDSHSAIALGGVARNGLHHRLATRLRETERVRLEHVEIGQFLYLFPGVVVDGLITGRLTYDTTLPLPAPFGRTLYFGERLLFRGFIGQTGRQPPMPYGEMERAKESESVFVFPRAGERYHSTGCRVIAVEPVERILGPAVRKSYAPCRLCRPGELPEGSAVYCFRTGRVYHRGSCFSVDRYVIELERVDAEAKGYTPCAVCGGG